MNYSRLAVLIVVFCLTPMASLSSDKKDESLSEQARKVHFSAIVLDTHDQQQSEYALRLAK